MDPAHVPVHVAPAAGLYTAVHAQAACGAAAGQARAARGPHAQPGNRLWLQPETVAVAIMRSQYYSFSAGARALYYMCVMA